MNHEPPHDRKSFGPASIALRPFIGACAGWTLALAGPVAAASQGSLGATSSGSVTITASVPQRAQVSGLSDIAFLEQDPSEAASGIQQVCVWSNTPSRTYTATASGSGTGGDFTLANAGREVPYSVHWASSAEQGGAASLSSGRASPTLSSAATQQECKSGPTGSASLLVRIEPADLQAMEPGVTYSGALTVMVSPQ